MSGNEEVPRTRSTQKPVYWKDCSPVEKLWILISPYIPITIWATVGMTLLWLSGREW